MNVTEALKKRIIAEVNWPLCLSRDHTELGDDYPAVDRLPPDMFDDAHDLEAFGERGPDSSPEHPGRPESLAILGTYRWMASPGVITLYRTNIEAYWRSLLKHAQHHYPFIYREEAERVLHLIVHSVYQHERFHYVCDFSRRLFGSSFDRWHEEALAGAMEWHWLKTQGAWNKFFGRMHPMIRRLVVHQLFHRTSRGYRDWGKYIVLADFNNAVRDYLCSQSSQLFADSDLDFGRWLVSHVPDDGNNAWVERIGF